MNACRRVSCDSRVHEALIARCCERGVRSCSFTVRIHLDLPFRAARGGSLRLMTFARLAAFSAGLAVAYGLNILY